MKVLVKKLNANAFVPMYAKPGDAGCDVCACLDEPKRIEPGCTMLIPLGFAMAIDDGFECQVRSRSGLALKNGIHVLNSPGTVDAGYRGEMGVLLHNTSNKPFDVKHGDRIGQLVFAPVTVATFSPVEELPTSERGTGGWGHTGV